MVTVEDTLQSKVTGLEMGADDYVTKPFNKDELVARINAVLRRTDYSRKSIKLIKCKDLIIDIEKHRVTIKKNPIFLTPKEFELLYLFLLNKNKLLTKEFILSVIWKESTPNTEILKVNIASLRKKIGEYKDRIETVVGRGYIFRTED